MKAVIGRGDAGLLAMLASHAPAVTGTFYKMTGYKCSTTKCGHDVGVTITHSKQVVCAFTGNILYRKRVAFHAEEFERMTP